VAVQQEVVSAAPQEVLYALYLGMHQRGLAELLAQKSDSREAVGWYTRSIDVLEGVLRRSPDPMKARLGLAAAYRGRAFASVRGGNVAALEDLDRALELEMTHHGQGWRVTAASVAQKAVVLALAGQHESAVALAQALDERVPWTGTEKEPLRRVLPVELRPMALESEVGEVFCLLARAFAVSATTVDRDTTLSKAEQEKRAEDYRERAVRLLERAKQQGYFARRLHTAILHEEPDFQALRGRADFQKLLRKPER
jgi:hypothetical protein